MKPPIHRLLNRMVLLRERTTISLKLLGLYYLALMCPINIGLIPLSQLCISSIGYLPKFWSSSLHYRLCRCYCFLLGYSVVFHLSTFIYKNQCSKLDPCDIRCLFLGYVVHQKGYRCYDPATKRTYVTMDVTFLGSKTFFSSSIPNSPRQREIKDDELNWLQFVGVSMGARAGVGGGFPPFLAPPRTPAGAHANRTKKGESMRGGASLIPRSRNMRNQMGDAISTGILMLMLTYITF
jgi:hypothetical protein